MSNNRDSSKVIPLEFDEKIDTIDFASFFQILRGSARISTKRREVADRRDHHCHTVVTWEIYGKVDDMPKKLHSESSAACS